MIILVILMLGFLAAFVDSIVGGGGLISLPALLLTGLPLVTVLGTNKLAASFSSLTSTISFIRSGKVNFKLVRWLVPLSFLGSVLGSLTIRRVPSEFMMPLVVVMLTLVLLYTLFRKDWGTISTYRGLSGHRVWLSGVVALMIGFYDGFFGPGTGSFLIFAFLLLGFDFVTAAGNAKVLNLASNLGSLLTFAFFHEVHYGYGLMMAVCMIAGAWIGSQMAIRKGAAMVKPLFITVTVALIGKQVWNLL